MSPVEAARQVERITAWLEARQWIPQTLVRLFVGYFFFETGWAKATNLAAMAERFAGWGIPWPALTVPLSVYTELIGGALILLGLATRLAAVPLLVNMVVALLAVSLRDVTSLDEFVELDTPLYVLFFLWLLFAGPGWLSLDHALWRRWRPDR